MGHEFFSTDEDNPIEGTLEHILPLAHTRLYAAKIPDWNLIVVADEPITPEKVQGWWNEDLDPNDEDYASNPPKLIRMTSNI